MNWPEYFIAMAELASTKSKDRSTKVGAVIVGSENQILAVGFNGFPRGINDDTDARHERPAKYMWTEHAERNAIYNAARSGVALAGATLYLNWAPIPCPDCSRACIQAGITRIVGPDRDFPGAHWSEPLAASLEMLLEAGIEMVTE